MAKKVFFKGEKFVFSRVKGNAETDYREGDINITPSNLGLDSVNNTSDKDKPVSIAQQKAIDVAYANSNKYTDQKIANLINGAPETMDTLKEVSDAITASKTTEEALNKAMVQKQISPNLIRIQVMTLYILPLPNEKNGTKMVVLLVFVEVKKLNIRLDKLLYPKIILGLVM